MRGKRRGQSALGEAKTKARIFLGQRRTAIESLPVPCLAELQSEAMDEGMRTLRADGWRKVKDGQTTIEEVLRVTQTEEHMNALAGDLSV